MNNFLKNFSSNRNSAVRAHINTTKSLFPHRRVVRRSEMTSRGLVVLEQEEEVSGLPAASPNLNSGLPVDSSRSRGSNGSSGKNNKADDADDVSAVKRSPIAHKLMRCDFDVRKPLGEAESGQQHHGRQRDPGDSGTDESSRPAGVCDVRGCAGTAGRR